MASIRSPALIPAFSAGEPFTTSCTKSSTEAIPNTSEIRSGSFFSLASSFGVSERVRDSFFSFRMSVRSIVAERFRRSALSSSGKVPTDSPLTATIRSPVKSPLRPAGEEGSETPATGARV